MSEFDNEFGPGVRTVRHAATSEALATLRRNREALDAAWDATIADLREALGDEGTLAMIDRAAATIAASTPAWKERR